MLSVSLKFVLLLAGLVLAAFMFGCNNPQSQPPVPSEKPTTTPTQAEKAQTAAPAGQESEAVKAARKLGKATDKPVVTTPSGLQYIDMVEGTGEAAKAGQQVTVDYTGWLVDGKKFDSSVDRNQPFSFRLGAGQVIKGWDEGVAGMKPGGMRKLIIPPALGYGESGSGPIAPNSTLIFDVQLLQAR